MGAGLNIEIVEAEPWPPEVEYTTKIITCSSCGATLEVTISSSPQQNKELNCPSCIATLTEQGVSVRIAIAGIPEWLGKYWPALVIVGIGLSLAFFGVPRQKEGYLPLEKKK